ncbi:hypothetical protein [Georgenia sp. SUBG003]|uniref:hypothetical protein n=1 Tax=Georgenia sp. SUBG003 TaxID=1497974 RepID=UPI003AB7215B
MHRRLRRRRLGALRHRRAARPRAHLAADLALVAARDDDAASPGGDKKDELEPTLSFAY